MRLHAQGMGIGPSSSILPSVPSSVCSIPPLRPVLAMSSASVEVTKPHGPEETDGTTTPRGVTVTSPDSESGGRGSIPPSTHAPERRRILKKGSIGIPRFAGPDDVSREPLDVWSIPPSYPSTLPAESTVSSRLQRTRGDSDGFVYQFLHLRVPRTKIHKVCLVRWVVQKPAFSDRILSPAVFRSAPLRGMKSPIATRLMRIITDCNVFQGIAFRCGCGRATFGNRARDFGLEFWYDVQ